MSGYEGWRRAARELQRERNAQLTDATNDPGAHSLPLPVPERRPFPLPSDRDRLEEINLPKELASNLAGQCVTAEVLPEAEAYTYTIQTAAIPSEVPFVIDRAGKMWNDNWPLRASFCDRAGRRWRIPRYWLEQGPQFYESGSRMNVTAPVEWTEHLHLPTWWDLWDANVDGVIAEKAAGKRTAVLVRALPGELVQVFWTDTQGCVWRIPANWRRRRIRLPDFAGLIRCGVPRIVAQEYAEKKVSVNWHPGSLCCMPDAYRFRDDRGYAWRIGMKDCTLLGYGDAEEGRS